MAGSSDGAQKGAIKKFRGQKVKHPRVAVNLDKKVHEAITKLAKREKTTPANWCREILTGRVVVAFPEDFPEYVNLINRRREMETQPA